MLLTYLCLLACMLAHQLYLSLLRLSIGTELTVLCLQVAFLGLQPPILLTGSRQLCLRMAKGGGDTLGLDTEVCHATTGHEIGSHTANQEPDDDIEHNVHPARLFRGIRKGGHAVEVNLVKQLVSSTHALHAQTFLRNLVTVYQSILHGLCTSLRNALVHILATLG